MLLVSTVFSLEYLKTYLRSTVHQSSLNHLLSFNINREKVDQLDNDVIEDVCLR